MTRYIIAILALAFVLGCTSPNNDELQLEYNPELVAETVHAGPASLQVPAGWQPMPAELKQATVGDTTLVIYMRPDSKAMLHVQFTQGDASERAEALKQGLQEQPVESIRDNQFRYRGQNYRQFIMAQETAVTYMLLVYGEGPGACELTYTLDNTIFESEIKKVESSIASVLLP